MRTVFGDETDNAPPALALFFTLCVLNVGGYLAGYFGGRWLRGEIFAAEQDAAPVLSVDVTPSEDGFRETIADAEARLVGGVV